MLKRETHISISQFKKWPFVVVLLVHTHPVYSPDQVPRRMSHILDLSNYPLMTKFRFGIFGFFCKAVSCGHHVPPLVTSGLITGLRWWLPPLSSAEHICPAVKGWPLTLRAVRSSKITELPACQQSFTWWLLTCGDGPCLKFLWYAHRHMYLCTHVCVCTEEQT